MLGWGCVIKIYFDNELNDYVYDAGEPKWWVKAVVPQENYTLILTFSSGEKRLFDAKPLLNEEIFFPLKNLSFFMNAKVEGDTVAWSDDVDIAPEYLYSKSVPITRSVL